MLKTKVAFSLKNRNIKPFRDFEEFKKEAIVGDSFFCDEKSRMYHKIFSDRYSSNIIFTENGEINILYSF